MKDYKEIMQEFLDELGRWGKGKYLWRDCGDGVEIRLFTDGNRYSITAKPAYLGCIVNSRKPRPGEDWTRGNDLADGKLDEETWNKILRDIVAYELKTISDYILNPPNKNQVYESAMDI